MCTYFILRDAKYLVAIMCLLVKYYWEDSIRLVEKTTRLCVRVGGGGRGSVVLYKHTHIHAHTHMLIYISIAMPVDF